MDLQPSASLDFIPGELRALDQWCIAGPDKIPYKIENGQYVRAKSNVGPWMSFDAARSIAQENKCYLGFILTEVDPFTCIDLDIKDRVDNVEPPTQEQIDFFLGILQSCNSYAELSTRGKGLHIWVKGNIGAGRKQGGIEVYSRERFIICTGNAVSELDYHIFNGIAIPRVHARNIKPISERQFLLDSLVGNFKSAENTIELVEVDQKFTDEEIWERAANASNGQKFIDLCEGRFSDYGFPSQSEADLALMSMFTFYSDSNEQCRRMFRQTKLGKREKAVKNDVYLNRTLKEIRARQEREKAREIKIDLVAMQTAQALRKQSEDLSDVNDALDVQTFINHAQMQQIQNIVESVNVENTEDNAVGQLAWPVGVVGALARFIYYSSPRPIKEVSIVSALGLMAGICGKTYHYSQSGLNMYMILIARSAIGKEAMHSGIALILKNLVQKTPTGQCFVDFTDFASGPALVKACHTNRSFINVAGEWGRKLKRLSVEDNKDGPMQQLRTVMTNLYQKSGPTSIVGGISYSNKDQNINSVDGVAYSMIGETTPGTFFEALTQSMMEDGFLSRFNIIQFEGERPPRNRQPVLTMDPKLVDLMVSLVVHSKKMLDNGQSVEVSATQEAEELLDGFDIECDNQINAAGDDESQRQMWNRAHLKCCRLCALLAVADNFINPVINKDHFMWSHDLVMRDINIMRTKLQSGDIGLDDDTRLKKLLQVMGDYIRGKVPKSYNVNYSMQKNGIVPRKFMQVRTAQLSSFSKYRNGATAALDATIKSAIDSGYIMEVDKNKLFELYGATGRCFRLLNLLN